MSDPGPDRHSIRAAVQRLAAADHVAAAELAALVRDMFLACGVGPAHADIATDAVMYASLRGIDSHGVVHMPLYVTGLLDGTIKRTPNFAMSDPMPCCRLLDADNGLGLVASRYAIDTAIELARSFGLGAVTVRNSSHFGAAGYYAEHAAAQQLIALAFCNASPALAPPGGREAMLGTNPIAAAFPIPDADPIVMDMATTVVARSRIRQAKSLGKSIPADWALDSEGRPTTDPSKAIEGSLQAIGGPKGYALALMTELLCSALSDGQPGFDVTYENLVKRPSRISHFFLVLDPAGFAGAERYGSRASHIAATLVGAKRIDPLIPPRLPGARGHAARRTNMREGIPMRDALRQALGQAADLLMRAGF